MSAIDDLIRRSIAVLNGDPKLTDLMDEVRVMLAHQHRDIRILSVALRKIAAAPQLDVKDLQDAVQRATDALNEVDERVKQRDQSAASIR